MFMCAENCQAIHGDFFGKMHHTIPVDSLTDFDLSGGMCAIHENYILDFVCKDCGCKKNLSSFCFSTTFEITFFFLLFSHLKHSAV